MELIATGLAVQLVALLALAALLLSGPPPPKRALRAREDGRTELSDDDSDGRLWRLLVALSVSTFVAGTAIDVVALTRT